MLVILKIGGTVTLQIAENIILRSGNLISAEAINDPNGGNINIDTRFIVAFPNGNNDIVANAEQGLPIFELIAPILDKLEG